MKTKNLIAAASFENKKFYFSDDYNDIPKEIKKNIKIICINTAEKLCCTFLMLFDNYGNIYFKTIRNEYDINFDEIGAELEIKKLQKKQYDLFKSLKIWYSIYKKI